MIVLSLVMLVAACEPLATRPGAALELDSGVWIQLGEAQWDFSGRSVAAISDSGDGYLVSSERFADFELNVEFRVADGTNSGVFARCQSAAEINPMQCYEFNIWDNHPQQQWRTGALVTIASPTAQVDTLGRWNHYRIRVHGAHLQAWINDVATIDLTDVKLASGHIALQYVGGGSVEFRNLNVRPLPQSQ